MMAHRERRSSLVPALAIALLSVVTACGGADVDPDAWRRSFYGQTERSLGGFEDVKVVRSDVTVTDAQIEKMVSAYCEMEASKSAMAGVLMWERASGASTFFATRKQEAVAADFAATEATASC